MTNEPSAKRYQIAAWVDQETHHKFRVLAAQSGLSMSKLLERLVHAELTDAEALDRKGGEVEVWRT